MTGAVIVAGAGLVIGALAMSRATWRSAAAYFVCLVMVGCAMLLQLGHPRPFWTERQAPGKPPVVLAYSFDEPHAIYLWLMFPGAVAPIYYEMPWNERTASKLSEAARKAKWEHRRPVIGFTGGKMMPYPQPQSALPPKTPRKIDYIPAGPATIIPGSAGPWPA